jgi:hypothetical protein
MDKENGSDEKKMSKPSYYRSLKATMDGRPTHRNGHPPYLEENELNVLRNRILMETLHNHCLTLKEVANLVCVLYFMLFFLKGMVYSKGKLKRK